MTTTLKQKKLLRGSRKLEIIDNTIFVHRKTLFKNEKVTIGLSILDPEPILNGKELEFHGRNYRHALFRLFIDKPNPQEFNAFVDTLRQRIVEESDDVIEIDIESTLSVRPDAPGWNVYEEPPGFDDAEESQPLQLERPVIPARLDEDISMLKTYLDENDIKEFLDTLEALKAAPASEVAFAQMVEAFNALEGFKQGAVLTYTAYLKVLLSQTISL